MNEYDRICVCDEGEKGDENEWGRELRVEYVNADINGFVCDWHLGKDCE